MHFGRWLKNQLDDRGLMVTSFARSSGIPRSTLNGWFSQSRPDIRGDNFKKLYSALQIDPDVIRDKLAVSKPDPIDLNVDPYSEVKVYAVPVFDLAVAAGTWTEITDVIELFRPGQVDNGLFRIYIRGDSMHPRWPNGALVEFRCLRDGRDELEIGEDYYVQVDGQGTFKRLEKFDEETLVFRAINRRKYPSPMPARRAEVVRMAKAIHMIVVPKK